MTGQRLRPFSLAAQRRREIERVAVKQGGANRHSLLAWHWHNTRSSDPVTALVEASKRMNRSGLTLAEAARRRNRDGLSLVEACALLHDGRHIRPRRRADALAKWLGVDRAMREELKLRTIGAIGFNKAARTRARKRKDKERKAARRREAGAKPHSQSAARTQRWKADGMSRAAWYRRQRQARETDSSPFPLPYGERDIAARKISLSGARGEVSKRTSEDKPRRSSSDKHGE